MDYQDIKKLIEDMGNSKLDSLEIEFPDGVKLRMKKEGVVGPNTQVPTIMSAVQTPVPAVTNVVTTNTTVEAKTEEKEGNIVKSPMVGTYYSKSSPKAEPFVKVGSKVKKGDVLCIIEAMKLMNEIESEFDGEIAEIYLKEEDVVEYGKPLFRIV